jgi:hypothetical protein
MRTAVSPMKEGVSHVEDSEGPVNVPCRPMKVVVSIMTRA